jgi:hypothetical protein
MLRVNGIRNRVTRCGGRVASSSVDDSRTSVTIVTAAPKKRMMLKKYRAARMRRAEIKSNIRTTQPQLGVRRESEALPCDHSAMITCPWPTAA